MRDRMFLNKLNRFLAKHGQATPAVTPPGIVEKERSRGGGGGGGGSGFVTPNAITDIANGREDMTVTPGAITDQAGGGGGSVAPNQITDIAGATAPNRFTDGGVDHGIGDTDRDRL